MQVTCISKVLICDQQRLAQAYLREKVKIAMACWELRQPGSEQREGVQPGPEPYHATGPEPWEGCHHHHWPQFSRTWAINTNTGD